MGAGTKVKLDSSESRLIGNQKKKRNGIRNNEKENMKVRIYNEEGRLVANNEETICELLENNGYIIDPPEKEMKKLRIEHGVDDV